MTPGTTSVVVAVNVPDAPEVSGVITRIAPVLAPSGTDVTMEVAESTVKRAATPLKVTDVAFEKPLPLRVTEVPTPPDNGVTELMTGRIAKPADTDRACDIVTTHVVVPLQLPDQPVNAESAAGTAVSVTVVPIANDAVHVVPQLIPVGVDVTVPDPSPCRFTLSVSVAGPNDAVADRARTADTVHVVAAPLQEPDHETRRCPAAGTAVRVTEVP